MVPEPLLILVRHGETDWNRWNRVQGGMDVPLNYTGIQQAHRVAAQLQVYAPSRLFSSSRRRARETAEVIGSELELPLEIDRRLDELRQGQWEGLRMRDIARRYPRLYQAWMRDPTSVCPPGGETIREVYRRVRAFWAAEISPRGDRIVVVAHKVVNALIRAVIENRTDLENLWGWLPGNAEFQVLPLSSTSPPDKPTSISANPRAGRQ